MVAVKQLQKACLRAGGSLGAEKLCLGELIFHILQVHQQLLQPKGGALADGGGLCRLKMCEGQCGQRLVFIRELCKIADDRDQLVAHQTQTLGHDDDVGVVADIAGGSAEVNDALCVRALHAVGVDMAHHIMAHQLFALGGDLVVDVVGVRLQLVDLRLRDGETEFHFRFGKGDPELAPGPEFFVG